MYRYKIDNVNVRTVEDFMVVTQGGIELVKLVVGAGGNLCYQLCVASFCFEK
jgi:hypothetical protein